MPQQDRRTKVNSSPEGAPVSPPFGEPPSSSSARVIKAGELQMAAIQAMLNYANAIVKEEWDIPDRRSVALKNAAEIKKAGIGIESALSPILLAELARSGPITDFQKILDDPSVEFSTRLKRLQIETASDFANLNQSALAIDINICPYLGRTINVEDLSARLEAVAALDRGAVLNFIETVQLPLLNQAHRVIALVDAIHFVNTKYKRGEEKFNYAARDDCISVRRVDIASTKCKVYSEVGKFGSILCQFDRKGEVVTIRLASNIDNGLIVWFGIEKAKITQARLDKGSGTPIDILDSH